jgi:flagellar biosynthesis/type III secretory pathway protein FliH
VNEVRGDPTYSRVSPRFWAETCRDGWTDDMKLLALYLLTCPHRRTEGLYLLPLGYMAEDLRWSGERVSASLAQLISEGFAEYDATARVVFLPRALKYQRPDNRNQITHAVRSVLELPETYLKARLLAAASQYAQGFAQALREALPQALAQGYTDPPAPAPAPAPAPEESPFVRPAAEAGRSDHVDSPQLPVETVENDNGSKKADADATFGLFYQPYPRHEAKAPAEKAWRRLTKAERQEAIAAARRMGEHIRSHGIELRLVPLPATWLHQHRWEDWRDGSIPAHYQGGNGKGSVISALQEAYRMTGGDQ